MRGERERLNRMLRERENFQPFYGMPVLLLFQNKIKTDMFGLFKNDPAKKLRKEYELLLEQARDIQRSGDLKAYARKLEEAERVWENIEKLSPPK